MIDMLLNANFPAFLGLEGSRSDFHAWSTYGFVQVDPLSGFNLSFYLFIDVIM